MYYLYKISNYVNGKIYIGLTKNPKRRWQQHKSDAKGKCKQYIHHAMAKYGIDNFTFEIISSHKILEDADRHEISLINQYNTRNKQYGYNIAVGGEHGMLGFHHSDDAKKKMSESRKGYKPSIETRQKMSKSRSKVIITDEWAQNISKSNKGKIISQETKDKMSKAQKNVNRNYTELANKAALSNKGKKRSLEIVNKIMANHKGFSGKTHTGETKLKISNALKNKTRKPMSQETKTKISESKKNKPAPNKGKTWKLIDGKRVWIKI